jgi:hypothetical protein
VRYLPTLNDWLSASSKATDYLAGPGFSSAIALLDLGVALRANRPGYNTFSDGGARAHELQPVRQLDGYDWLRSAGFHRGERSTGKPVRRRGSLGGSSVEWHRR